MLIIHFEFQIPLRTYVFKIDFVLPPLNSLEWIFEQQLNLALIGQIESALGSIRPRI